MVAVALLELVAVAVAVVAVLVVAAVVAAVAILTHRLYFFSFRFYVHSSLCFSVLFFHDNNKPRGEKKKTPKKEFTHTERKNTESVDVILTSK